MESLELILSEIIDNLEVEFEVAYGDITSDKSVNSSNVKSKITDLIKSKA